MCVHVCVCVIRGLSPELQEDVARVLANGNLLLKAKLMPGIAGVGPRTGLSQQQIASLPAGLNSQVRLLHVELRSGVFCHTTAITCIWSTSYEQSY